MQVAHRVKERLTAAKILDKEELSRRLEWRLHTAVVDYQYCLFFPDFHTFRLPPGPRNVRFEDFVPVKANLSTTRSSRQAVWDQIEKHLVDGGLPEDLHAIKASKEPLPTTPTKGSKDRDPIFPQSSGFWRDRTNALLEMTNSISEGEIDEEGTIGSNEATDVGDHLIFNVNPMAEPRDAEKPLNEDVHAGRKSLSHGEVSPPRPTHSQRLDHSTDIPSDQALDTGGDAMQVYADANTTHADMLTQTKPVAERVSNRKLSNLSSDELKVQIRYFHTCGDADIDMDLPPRCLTCASPEHESKNCSNLECGSCGAEKQHITENCPRRSRCSKCHERGHQSAICPYKLKAVDMENAVCDICMIHGHLEQDCELLWRTSGKPWAEDVSDMRSSFSCFECGNSGHLGNDCPSRRPGKSFGTSTWSIDSRYDIPARAFGHPMSFSRPKLPLKAKASSKSAGMTIRGRAQQQDLLPPEEDLADRSGFLHSKALPPRPPGQIRIRGLGRQDFGPPDHGYRAYDRDTYPEPGVPPLRDRQRRDYRVRSRSPPRGDGRDNGWSDALNYGDAPSARSNAYRPSASAGQKAWSRFRS